MIDIITTAQIRGKEEVEIAMARKERRDKGGILLTERDDLVLHWISEQYGIRFDQLQRLLGKYPGRSTNEAGMVGVTTAAGVVDRWRKLDLICTRKFRYREPAWIWLTRAGLKHLGLDYSYKELNLVTLEHLYWVNQVRLATEARTEEKKGSRVWISERRIRRDTPRPEGRDILPQHFPDAVVQSEKSRIAVEVELTLKKPRDLEGIMNILAEQYAGVWYFFNERTQTGVKNALALLPEASRKKFDLLDLRKLV
jgi:hypothetical protein